MAIKKLIPFFILFLTDPFSGSGQQKTVPLKIGDRLTDLEFTAHSGRRINIQELYTRGPLIIDFWATWCVPCLKEIRYTDSLSRKFPGRFSVLLVSMQDRENIKAFLDRPANKDLIHLAPNMLSGDTLFNQLFPHRSIPHNIWIDTQGTVRAVTGSEDITEKNILDFAANLPMLKVRGKKENLDFKRGEPFHLGDSTFTYRSIVSPYIEGLPSGQLSSQKGERREYFQYNQNLLQALWAAYSGFNPGIRWEMVVLSTRDSSRYMSPKLHDRAFLKKYGYEDRKAWEEKNLFCYALTLPKPVPDAIFSSYIFSDMERQFRIKTTISERNIHCVVVTSGQKRPKKSLDRHRKPEITFTPERRLIVKNSTLTELLDFLFRRLPPERLPYPFNDRSGYPEDFRFDLEEDYSKEPEVLKNGMTAEIFFRRLSHYGLNFTAEIVPYPVLVISDPE
ncbi:hypothetical protein OC25_03830 [Pedobacter kyungheensis]|uniref:AhpC/TSA family protein n=2 Tax=Pedobacter TaxID=84567 RepID=A0A1G6K2T4_9SPHI|nr:MULTISPECIES: TlpA disulfide reductase family protein [Pedobacter]KIA96218.1 hypothetical protein OC25_03830 [Pedobacter kyungheensis]SDC25352.1 AhpC/TSA family protein [Pedobacter soli]